MSEKKKKKKPMPPLPSPKEMKRFIDEGIKRNIGANMILLGLEMAMEREGGLLRRVQSNPGGEQ